MLEVDGIVACYGDLKVLWSVSLNVQEKEILTIIGSNGAGKSTLLRTIVGLHKPVKGRLLFENFDLSRISAHRRVDLGICLVPEGRGLFPGMTIAENLELGAFNPAARRARQETFQFVYGMFPLLEKRSRQLAGTLSGGEQQMVAIGRGLMSKPKLLLMDEPSLGLAPLVVEEIFAVIGKINQAGVTVVLVEQNVRVSMELAKRAYIIESGRIVGHGAASDLVNDERVKEAYLGLEAEQNSPEI
jgi:branched-chain amino acid transport system ATP-binding protein